MKTITSYAGRTVLLFGAVALVAAGCGKDNGADGSSSIGGGTSNSVVSVASVDGHEVLVDATGHTLYSTVAEKSGQIHCVAGCTTFWVPVTASAADAKAASTALGAKLGVVGRPEGASQLTFKGLPLYTFAEEGAGALKGNGFTDDFQGTHFVWAAATTHGTAPKASGGSGSGSYTPSSSGGGYGY